MGRGGYEAVLPNTGFGPAQLGPTGYGRRENNIGETSRMTIRGADGHRTVTKVPTSPCQHNLRLHLDRTAFPQHVHDLADGHEAVFGVA